MFSGMHLLRKVNDYDEYHVLQLLALMISNKIHDIPISITVLVMITTCLNGVSADPFQTVSAALQGGCASLSPPIGPPTVAYFSWILAPGHVIASDAMTHWRSAHRKMDSESLLNLGRYFLGLLHTSYHEQTKSFAYFCLDLLHL